MRYHIFYADGTDQIMSEEDFKNNRFNTPSFVMHMRILTDSKPEVIRLSGNVLNEHYRRPFSYLPKKRRDHV